MAVGCCLIKVLPCIVLSRVPCHATLDGQLMVIRVVEEVRKSGSVAHILLRFIPVVFFGSSIVHSGELVDKIVQNCQALDGDNFFRSVGQLNFDITVRPQLHHKFCEYLLLS